MLGCFSKGKAANAAKHDLHLNLAPVSRNETLISTHNSAEDKP